MGESIDTTGKASQGDKKPRTSFFKGLKAEYNKIVFADKDTITRQTIAVLISSVVLGAVIALLDTVIRFGLGFIL